MREILFRGKSVDIYGWIYGHYVHQYGADMIYLPNGVDRECGFDYYYIKPETVGQYIGVEDKNGKKVFEGDILRYTPRPKCTIYYKVIWNQEWSRFALVQWSTHKYQLYEWAQHDTIKYCCEVIGNIHDNPDLLESLENN